MKIFITGANGFLGRAVTDIALENGHHVKALVRSASKKKAEQYWGKNENLELVHTDLRLTKPLTEALEGVDAVIHLAATKAGDFYTQFAGTVVGTESLIKAMKEAHKTNLVGISTFSVYEYLDLEEKTLIDENSLTVTDPKTRDEYCQTKLIQEELYTEFGEDNNVTIIRPGMIFGAGELWHALLGSPFGPRFLKIGSKSVLPMTYVENCAEAIVKAAERIEDPSVNGEIFNIVDDDLLTQAEYAKLVSSKTDTPKSIPIPWSFWKLLTGSIQKFNSIFLRNRAKFPGLFAPAKVHARFKPLTYSNEKAKSLLGWQPKLSLEEAIEKSIEIEKQTND